MASDEDSARISKVHMVSDEDSARISKVRVNSVADRKAYLGLCAA